MDSQAGPKFTEQDVSREFAVKIVRQLQEAGYTAYWAGGCVRDILLGKKPKDYDVATDARPETVRELFGRARTHGVGAVFGVMLIHGHDGAGDAEPCRVRQVLRRDHVAEFLDDPGEHRSS